MRDHQDDDFYAGDGVPRDAEKERAEVVFGAMGLVSVLLIGICIGIVIGRLL